MNGISLEGIVFSAEKIPSRIASKSAEAKRKAE
jgi:hypothetical protein